jgi:hypothetical protein
MRNTLKSSYTILRTAVPFVTCIKLVRSSRTVQNGEDPGARRATGALATSSGNGSLAYPLHHSSQ